MKKPALITSWVAQILAAAIMLQTVFLFKLQGAAETTYIFETVGLGQFGVYSTAAAELVAGILLFIPPLAWLGAVIGIGVMSGALFFHLFGGLGIAIEGVTSAGDVIENDGGTLFVMALLVFTCCLIVLFLRRQAIPFIGAKLADSSASAEA